MFVDYLGANMLGIIAGYYVLKFLNARQYDWGFITHYIHTRTQARLYTLT